MNIRTISTSGIVAALYIAVTFLVQPLAFGAVQLRLSEMFNHLVVFNKKYFFGIVIGVFLANLFFSPMKLLDITFGVAHTVISLGIVIFLEKYVKNILARMFINSLVFSIMIFIVSWELKIAFGTPFFETWGVLALGEFAVMLITMPIMYAIHKGVHFDKLFK